MKYSQLLTFLILSILIGACSTNKLNPVEADRSMKILNGNMVNLFTVGSEKPEYQALSFLMDQITSPLPYVRRANPNQAKKPYSFEDNKGVYRWNTSINAFEKTAWGEKINLFFPSGEKEFHLELTKFQSQSFSSRPDFPTNIEGFLLNSEQKILNIRHRATISNNLPESITTEIRGTDYTIELKLNRTQQGNDGKLLIDINLKTKGEKVLAANINALIENMSYGYSTACPTIIWAIPKVCAVFWRATRCPMCILLRYSRTF